MKRLEGKRKEARGRKEKNAVNLLIYASTPE